MHYLAKVMIFSTQVLISAAASIWAIEIIASSSPITGLDLAACILAPLAIFNSVSLWYWLDL